MTDYLRIDTLAINPAALFFRGKILDIIWLRQFRRCWQREGLP